MTAALIVSNLLLWAAVVVLALTVAALVRQVGVLHECITPAGALVTRAGPEVGESAPAMTVATLAGENIEIGGSRPAGATLLFFVSPTCPVCKALLPAVESVARAEGRDVRVVLASDGELDEQRRFVAAEALERFPYVVSTELGLAYRVAQLPYAVLIDADAIVRAKGIVNTREHLESLFEAERRGVASVQAFVAAATDTADAREQGRSVVAGSRS